MTLGKNILRPLGPFDQEIACFTRALSFKGSAGGRNTERGGGSIRCWFNSIWNNFLVWDISPRVKYKRPVKTASGHVTIVVCTSGRAHVDQGKIPIGEKSFVKMV